MKFLQLAALVALSVPGPLRAQTGAIIYKETPWEADGFAKVTLYKKLERFPTVHNVHPMSGPVIRVKSALVQKDLPFPPATKLADISEEGQVVPVEKAIADWKAALRRFPQGMKHLKPTLAHLESEVAQFRSGKVKVEGVWMTPEALAQKRNREAEERVRLIAKLEREARATAAAAAEWSRKDQLERQQKREAMSAMEEKQFAANEESRIENEIRRREELAARRAEMKPGERLATDEWITPPQLKEAAAKEYEENLKIAGEELAKIREKIGYGRESQKMVVVTPRETHAFKPQLFTPEVLIERPGTEEDAPAWVVLVTAKGEQAVETYASGTDQVRRSAALTIPTNKEVNLEKLTKSLSRLIEICGGKRFADQDVAPKEEVAKKE